MSADLHLRRAIIARLFAESLGVAEVGPDDGFFHLGGRSIEAMTLAAKIRSALGAEVGIRQIFEAPSPRRLAASLTRPNTRSSLSPVFPLRIGLGTPIFCVHPLIGLSWCYSTLIDPIKSGDPIYALQAQGIEPSNEHRRLTADERLECYVRCVKSIQETGPYRLIGWSLGGNIAHSIACRLQGQGDSVSLLALLGSFPAPAGLFQARSGLPTAGAYLDYAATQMGYHDRPGPIPAVTMKDFTDFVHENSGRRIGHLSYADVTRIVHTSIETLKAFSQTGDKFSGRLLLIESADSDIEHGEQDTDWSSYADETVTHVIDCRHGDMLEPGPASTIGSIVSDELSIGRGAHHARSKRSAAVTRRPL